MKLFVPEIGTKLKLTQPWQFKLYNERRNLKPLQVWNLHKDPAFVQACSDRQQEHLKSGKYWGGPGYQDAYLYDMEDYAWDCMLSADTVLQVDRIFIRKGMSGYSSLTFVVPETDDTALNTLSPHKRRFWAKLDDVNNIECEIIS